MAHTMGRILFLCTGNICRSALGHHRLGHLLEQQVPGAYEVSSAGTHVNLELRPPRQILGLGGEELSETLGSHEPRQLRRALVQDTDLLLAATEEHMEYVLQETPAMLNRSFTILEFAALADLMLAEDVRVDGDLRALARAAARQRSTVRTQAGGQGALDLADPYGGPDKGYQTMDTQLGPAVESIARLLVRQARGTAG